ncbi:putative RRM domain-containing protein [Seiridium cardinale]
MSTNNRNNNFGRTVTPEGRPHRFRQTQSSLAPNNQTSPVSRGLEPPPGVGYDLQPRGKFYPTQAVERAMKKGYDPTDLRGNQHCENSVDFQTKRPCFQADISRDKNTSLFIGTIPESLLRILPNFFQVFHDRGIKIYSLVIRDTRPEKGQFNRVVYLDLWNRESAQRALDIINAGGLVLGGLRARASWNRYSRAPPKRLVKVPEVSESRAIVVQGPYELVNRNWLMLFFQKRFLFQFESINVLESWTTNSGTIAQMRWVFGSYRCQAELAVEALHVEYGHVIQTWYDRDPC